jgi:hypothetical protein
MWINSSYAPFCENNVSKICRLYSVHQRNITGKYSEMYIYIYIKVKISLLQAVEAPGVARGRGSHIT